MAVYTTFKLVTYNIKKNPNTHVSIPITNANFYISQISQMLSYKVFPNIALLQI